MRNNKLRIICATLGSVGLLTHFAVGAQQAATPPVKTEKIEVTGSNIKRVDAESASPITVITQEEIRRSGSTSVQELLNNLSVSAGSALTDISGGNGFSTGSATVALRGLGSAATLTLINGRRVSPAAFNDPNVGSTNITNLNSIPTAAIERIEVLRDGASAIYGSDAIAGVVNIILRKDFTGLTATGTFFQTPGNEFRVKQASVAFGFGDLTKDRYNVFGTYERFERLPVLIKSEDNVDTFWTNPVFLQRQSVLSSLSYPGNYYRQAVPGSGIFGTFQALGPNCPATLVIGGLCRYNQWNDLEQQGRSERDTAFVRGTLDINGNLSAFAEANFSRTTNTFTGAPTSSNPQTATLWRNAAGQALRFQLVLPVGHRDNPFATPIGLRYRWVDLGRSQDISRTEDTRVLVGLKGSIGSWDWESGLLLNKSTANVSSGRRLLFPAVQDAINDQSWLFFAPNSQAMINRISTRTTNKGEANTRILDIKGSTEFGKLPAGPIGLAVGVEFRKDDILITPDQRIVDAQIVGLGASFADGSRTQTSAYLEALVPITKSLEGTLATRYDKYSDFGNTTNPKVGLKWRALPTFVVRGSYSTGFRAPTLSQTSKAAVRSFQTINDPLRCPVLGTTSDDCSRTVSAQIVPNPNIGPETSKSRNLGIVWDISKDLNVAIDYFDIKRDDEIDRFSSNFSVNALFNGDQRFAGVVQRDPNPLTWLPGVPNSGPVQTVDRRWLNLGTTQVKGIDVDLAHRMSLGSMGRLTNTFTGTYTLSTKVSREKGGQLVENVGGVDPFVTGLGRPRFRGNVATTWAFSDWTLGARLNYIGGWNNSGSTLTCAQLIGQGAIDAIPGACKVKGWRTLDINASYSGIKNLTLRMVVRNLTNEKPPFDYFGGDTTLGFNPNFHNALGIYPSLSATYRFK